MSLDNYIYQLEQLAAQAPGTHHERLALELIERAGDRRQKQDYVEIERRKRERRKGK